ncbi:MAG: L,D-transpeptidase family protein [Acidimicrobiales bacterium]|jgi:peptidoglycan hydrolase-like protein with peptidoglycan-binding domain
MGLGKLTTNAEQSLRRRVFGIVTALVLVVALAAAGTLVALQQAHTPSSGGPRAHPTTTLPPPPLTITSVTPSPGTSDAAFDTSVTVDFSQPLAADSPLPTLSPAPPGDWVRTAPAAVRFVPRGYFAPFATVQLSVPGGPAGIRSRYGQDLSATLRKNFVIEGGSELRLQQLLAELGYLPLQFVPATPEVAPSLPVGIAHITSGSDYAYESTTTTTAAPVPAIDSEPSVAAEVPVQALPGSLVWRSNDTPAPLVALWKSGQLNVITTGAVMAFESAHGLTVDGEAGPRVWSELLQAVALRQVSTAPYDYVVVSQTLPETASVWRDGQILFTTYVNTGIAVAPTASGTYPVFARYRVTTMTGKEPDGRPYSDPGIPWVSYFNGGDALHGYIRASYGFPQSLGCVEMPYADAETMFPLTPIGTLVTVLANPTEALRGSI